MEQEQLNITKIKDGFFLGDEYLSQCFDIFAQFKISHIVNAAGLDAMNLWEKLGIRYLTLNWSDSSTQRLFDPKDEIAERVVCFIDEAIETGDGVLVHCSDSTNRGFKWTLNKSIQFLSSKKADISIPTHFLRQICAYEGRLQTRFTNFGVNKWESACLSSTLWYEGPVSSKREFSKKNRLKWRENNAREPLDLALQPQVSVVDTHRLNEPTKSILKGSKLRKTRSRAELKKTPSQTSFFSHKRQSSVSSINSRKSQARSKNHARSLSDQPQQEIKNIIISTPTINAYFNTDIKKYIGAKEETPLKKEITNLKQKKILNIYSSKHKKQFSMDDTKQKVVNSFIKSAKASKLNSKEPSNTRKSLSSTLSKRNTRIPVKISSQIEKKYNLTGKLNYTAKPVKKRDLDPTRTLDRRRAYSAKKEPFSSTSSTKRFQSPLLKAPSAKKDYRKAKPRANSAQVKKNW